MNRQVMIGLAITAGLIVWGNQAMAVKAVAKSSGDDTAQAVTAPSAPDKAADAKPAQPIAPAPKGQAPSQAQPVVRPSPPQDNFIDRDGDGINDNIPQHRPPEIKRDRVEPSRKTQQPQRNEPSRAPESRKAEERKTGSSKH
jgi:hypothetical protein